MAGADSEHGKRSWETEVGTLVSTSGEAQVTRSTVLSARRSVMSDGRMLGRTDWNVWRTIIGVFYLAAAAFNVNGFGAFSPVCGE